VRKTLRKLVLDLFGTFAKPARGVHILNGHYLSRTNGQAGVFQAQLSSLQKMCRLIRIEEAVSLIVNQAKVNEPLVAFTFDDGFEECATGIAPVLESFNINAAFFINPNFIDGDSAYRDDFLTNIVDTPIKRPMTWEQIGELHKRGHVIGSHALDHVRLLMDDPAILNLQLQKSRQIIEAKINAPCEYFAYPFGGMHDLSDTALALARKQYKYIFSQSDHRHNVSFGGAVINRRHFEPYWPVSHVNYFLSVKKS
jgi:peptidoglycan/xylan/chitin deacetylase (PgdA/CDA1 family)